MSIIKWHKKQSKFKLFGFSEYQVLVFFVKGLFGILIKLSVAKIK